MYYYAETNYYDHDGIVTSGGKGRDDYFEMLRRCGLERIEIPTLKKSRRVSAPGRLGMELRLAAVWRKALKGLGRGDVLFIHNPPSEKFVAFPEVIAKAMRRGCRVAVIVFDLENYLKPYYSGTQSIKYMLSLRAENKLLRMADFIMVHNDRMKETVVSMGCDPDSIASVGVMDYLRDNPPDGESIARRTGRTLPLVVGGNLMPKKAGFLSNLPDELTISLYGPGYQSGNSTNIDYKGSVPSVELMDVISGSFGLVWDGISSDTGRGTGGEYLRINNPHKFALYVASGLPVIVWKESAMADMVIKENIGFAVNSLAEVKELIDGMTDEEYAAMRDNAIRIGCTMRRGDHIRAAVNQIIRMAESGDR